MKKLVAAFALTLLLPACAHHNDVRPGDKGIHRVVISTDDTQQGSRNAIDQANHFCKQKGEHYYAVILKEDKKYTGSSMSEQEYGQAKTATKFAKNIGILGGAEADSAVGNGYNVEMKFKCAN